jgi:hypothetical protein
MLEGSRAGDVLESCFDSRVMIRGWGLMIRGWGLTSRVMIRGWGLGISEPVKTPSEGSDIRSTTISRDSNASAHSRPARVHACVRAYTRRWIGTR